MTPGQIAEPLPRLEEFTAEIFSGFARVDQRAKDTLYMRDLMTDGARKSMQPMAERLGIDHDAYIEITWRHTSRRRSSNPDAATTGNFLALPVRPVNHRIPRNPDGSLPFEPLIVPPGVPRPGVCGPCGPGRAGPGRDAVRTGEGGETGVPPEMCIADQTTHFSNRYRGHQAACQQITCDSEDFI